MTNHKSIEDWHPKSWQSKPSAQQLTYPDEKTLKSVLDELSTLPPLVTELEIDGLTKQLGEAAVGKRFLLQGGDCAESFDDCTGSAIISKLKILLQMSLVLIHGLRKPIIRVGRIAGQYAKPRSAPVETQGKVTLPSYRGDLINHLEFDAASRTPNPKLMLQGYNYSALTLNYIRALVDGGFANLMHPEYWELDFMKHSSHENEYQTIVNSIRDSLDFLKTISGLQQTELQRVNFYTSHEALHLLYEEALTRQNQTGKYYNVSTHFPWIGMRTANLDGAHVEYLRGIENPIAVKIGPAMTTDSIRQLVETLNPDNIPGKLTLTHRFGFEKISELLPPLVEAVKQSGITVLWSCDPMHGNTGTTNTGLKTRRFDDILSELKQAFKIHQQMDSYLGGVHIELTGDNVTECTGGARGLSDEDLKRAYKSLCDPRLNYEQALEMAMLVVQAQD